MNDFESLNFTNFKNIKTTEGKVGLLEDGRTVSVRSVSTDGRPTLEIYNPKTKESIKIRYGSRENT